MKRKAKLSRLEWLGRILSTGGLALIFERREMELGMCPACGELKERGHSCNAY